MDNFIFTTAGLNYAAQTTTGNKLVFTKGEYGDGTATATPQELTAIVHKVGDLKIQSQSINGSQATIETQFTNITTDGTAPSFHLKEMGLYAKMQNASGEDLTDCPETLVAYAYVSGTDAGDYISDTPTVFTVNWNFNISNTDNVTVNVDLDAYVKQGQFASTTQAGMIKLLSSAKGVNRSGIVVETGGTAYINTRSDRGIARDGSGQLGINPATADEIEAGTDNYKPITPATFKPYKKSIDSLTTYSTTPVQVGTWIDGTPIWRMAFDNEPLFPKTTANSDGTYDHCSTNLIDPNDFNAVQWLNAAVVCGIDPTCCIDSDMVSLDGEKCGFNSKFSFYHSMTGQSNDYKISGYIDFITTLDNLSKAHLETT